jgi:hypothetical protein
VADYDVALQPGDQRILIVGGPMTGKSTLAAQLHERTGFPVFCGDPRSTTRNPRMDVTYLPETIGWRGAPDYVRRTWLSRTGPWIIEGHVTARALIGAELSMGAASADRILVLRRPHPAAQPRDGHHALTVAVLRCWDAVAPVYGDLATELTLPQEESWAPLDAIAELGRSIMGEG